MVITLPSTTIEEEFRYYNIAINAIATVAGCQGGCWFLSILEGFQRFSVSATRDWNGGYNCCFL
jgi:hypothetical protein